MFKKNNTKFDIFSIAIGNLIIILFAFAYVWWFYQWHVKSDCMVSELFGIKTDISQLNKMQSNILDKELFDNNFLSTGKNELTETYKLQINKAQKKIVNLIDVTEANTELANLYTILKEDLLILESENKLLLNYLTEAGNKQTGIYSNLIIAENNFLEKTVNSHGALEIKKQFNQIAVFSKVFYLYNDIVILNITNNHIDALLTKLNIKRQTSNSYNELRLIDALQEYKQVFNLFARKLMQIGIRNDDGIRKKLTVRYKKINGRIDKAITIIEHTQQEGNVLTGVVISILILLSISISFFFNYKIIKRIRLFINESEYYFLSHIKGKSAKAPVKIPNNDYSELQKQMNFYSEKLALTSKMLSDLADRGAVLGKVDVFKESVFPQVQNIDKHIRSLNKQLKSETNQTLINEWIRKGLASFSDVLRRNFDKPQQHAKEILSNLVDYLNIPMGAIYLPSAKENNTFDLVGSIAYGKQKNYIRSVISGEGIIGTAAKEKKTLNITDIPENYFKVSSGFGEAKPKNIVAIPIKLENEIYGIIELASLNKFKKFELEFIDELSRNLGASFAITDVFIKTKEKLEQTKKDYSIVKTESELYKTEIENIKHKNNFLENKNFESEIITNSLDTIALVAELDIDGNIQKLNNAFIELLKRTENRLIRTHYWDLTTQSGVVNSVNLEKFWNNVRSGITGSLEQNFLVSKKNIWLSETYVPIKNKLGKVEKIKLIAFNKTELSLLEIQLANLKESLNKKDITLNSNKADFKKLNKKMLEQAETLKENNIAHEASIVKLKEEFLQTMTKYTEEQQHKESALYNQITNLRNELENLKK